MFYQLTYMKPLEGGQLRYTYDMQGCDDVHGIK